MVQFNFPTTMYYGSGSVSDLSNAIRQKKLERIMLVTDETLVKIGLAQKLSDIFKKQSLQTFIFSQVHPNPIEEDIEAGVSFFRENNCDCFVALGGGSPMDAAKVIKIMVAHPEPLKQYDDAIGGDKKITNPMSPLFAIPTTAGTGSEVGRSGVVILRETGRKTIFFAPELIPDLAVLDPDLTTGLPPHITAATGIDAFTHSLEAYFAPGFHPMADGIALEGMKLVIENLKTAVQHGMDLEARGKMLIAASMGATAFQKGLGMIHSLAHPLSSKYNTHHGLANALLLPICVQWLEQQTLNVDQTQRIKNVLDIFDQAHMAKESLSSSCKGFFEKLGIEFGLKNHKVKKEDFDFLSQEAFEDPCHSTNMIPVTVEILRSLYEKAY